MSSHDLQLHCYDLQTQEFEQFRSRLECFGILAGHHRHSFLFTPLLLFGLLSKSEIIRVGESFSAGETSCTFDTWLFLALLLLSYAPPTAIARQFVSLCSSVSEGRLRHSSVGTPRRGDARCRAPLSTKQSWTISNSAFPA